MAVLYRLLKNQQKKSKAFGKYYAKAVMTQVTDLDMLADKIQRNCTAKRSDVMAVLAELVEVMQEELQASHRVKLNGFGSFKIGISSSGAEDVKKFSTAEHIKSLHVNFAPESKADGSHQRTKTFVSGCKVQEAPKYATEVADDGETEGEGA